MDMNNERYEYAVPTIIAFILFFNSFAMFTLHCVRTESDHLIRILLIFIWNICFSDVLLGLMLIVNTVLYTLYKNTEERNHIYNIINMIETLATRMTLTVTAVMLFIVTLMRMMALTKTYFRYRVNRTLILHINVAVWFISALIVGTYNCMFKFYLKEPHQERYQHIFVPIVVIPSVFLLTICHIFILKIIKGHDLSMQTYLQTLRRYVSTNSIKQRSARNIFAITLGLTRNSSKSKHKTNNAVPRRMNSCKDSIIIENNYAGHLADRKRAKKQALKDKEKCKKQVKFLFRTKDISLLRFEVFAFLICWLPLSLVELLHLTDVDAGWYSYQNMRLYTLLLAFVKSAFTPCVFLMYKKHELFKYFKRKFSTQTTQSNTMKSSCSTVTTEI